MISSANWRAHHGLYRHLGSFMKICSGFNVRRKRKWAARARGEEGDSKGEEARRVCDGCRTSETPLWRKGSNGNQTLCNACGIRERKRIQSSKINKKSSSTGIFSSSSSSSTLEELRSEELKQRQKEKQMMMLKLMGWNKKRMMAKVRRIDKDEAEAALLLLSLSSPLV